MFNLFAFEEAPGVQDFDLSVDGREIWTASAVKGNIYGINTETKKITYTIQTGIFGENRERFTKDEKYVLISSLNGSFVHNRSSAKKIFTQIKLGTGASEILVDEICHLISCTSDNYIAMLDLRSFEVKARIDVGEGRTGSPLPPFSV